MGNCFAGQNHDELYYEPFINNGNGKGQNNTTEYINRIIKLESENDYLSIEIRTLKEKNDGMEIKVAKIEQQMHNKYQELQNAIYNNNERICVIAKDMEALLNNDKILLDKLIEKNIVSTIQEED